MGNKMGKRLGSWESGFFGTGTSLGRSEGCFMMDAGPQQGGLLPRAVAATEDLKEPLDKAACPLEDARFLPSPRFGSVRGDF